MDNNKDDNDILILFVSIFDIILSSPVKFPQARPLPLIFHAIFDKDNHFKKACIAFLKHYQLFNLWNNMKSNKSSTSSNKVSAEDRFNSFRLCLQEIITKKQINNAILPPMQHHHIMTIDEAHQQCKIHYKRVIEKFLIYWESKENCHNSEKLSKIHHYIDIISEYHHNDMEFFTINKSMVSNHTRLYPTQSLYQLNDTRSRDGCTDNMSNTVDDVEITDNFFHENLRKSKSVESGNRDQIIYNHTEYPSNSSWASSNYGGSNGYSPQHNHNHPHNQHVQPSNMGQLTHTHSNDCVFCANQQQHNHHYHSNPYHSSHHAHGNKNRSLTIDGSNVEFNNERDCRSHQQSEFQSNWKYTNNNPINHNNQQNKPQQINQISWHSQQDNYNLHYLQNTINTGSNHSNVNVLNSHNSNASTMNTMDNRNSNINSNNNNSNNTPSYSHSHYQQQQHPSQPPSIPRQHSYPNSVNINHNQFQQYPQTPPSMSHHQMQHQQGLQSQSQNQRVLQNQNPSMMHSISYQNQNQGQRVSQQQPIVQTQNNHSVHQQQAILQTSQWMNNNNNNNLLHHPMNQNPNISTNGSDVFAANNSDPMDQDDAMSIQTIQSNPNYIHGMTMPSIQPNNPNQYGHNHNINLNNNPNNNLNDNSNNRL